MARAGLNPVAWGMHAGSKLFSMCDATTGYYEWSFLLSEEGWPDEELELEVEEPIFEILGDVYVCSSCGCPLTEIPEYNRFYCEYCGLHY